MASTEHVIRPADAELLDRIADGVTPAEIANWVPCSIDSVCGSLRRLGYIHNRKGVWFLPDEASITPPPRCRSAVKPQIEVRRGVVPEQFPFIRTHIKITDDGSCITLPDLSILAAARADLERRERRQ